MVDSGYAEILRVAEKKMITYCIYQIRGAEHDGDVRFSIRCTILLENVATSPWKKIKKFNF